MNAPQAQEVPTTSGVASTQASVEAMEAAMQGFERTTLNDLLDEQNKLMKSAKDASKLGDAAEKAARLEIINADMDSLRAKIVEYREDTAELITGLEAQFAKIGIDISALQKPTEEDLSLIKRAEEHLASLDLANPSGTASLRKKELDEALATAKTKWFGKENAVEHATTNLAAFAEAHVADTKEAKLAIEEAKAEVERMRRKRIREADFDSQFQRFIDLASQIQASLLQNVKDSEARMVQTKKELNDSLAQKETLATQMKKLDSDILKTEGSVRVLDTEIANAIDPAVKASKEKERGVVVQKLADQNGTRQEMQVAFNAFEAAVTKHETMLQAVQVQRDNQSAHARKLSIDSKARFVQAQNLVMIVKNQSQEDAAERLHQAGSKLDTMGMEAAARALVASERTRLNMLKGHEQDIKNFARITGDLAAGRANIAIEDAEIAARMQKNYGIDSLQSSWLHVMDHMTQENDTQKAA